MDAVADMPRNILDEIRVSHEQNLILPMWRWRTSTGLSRPGRRRPRHANAGLITDIIACPRVDYCALANARSIPVAQEISNRFGSPERQAEIGELKIKISGCINAAAIITSPYRSSGRREEGRGVYQINARGSGDEHTSIGEIMAARFEPEK